MRVAILCESEGDEVGLRLLVEAVLGSSTVPGTWAPRARGWPSVANVLPVVLRDLHYRDGCDALVVVADTNGSRVLSRVNQQPEPEESGTRLSKLEGTIRQVQSSLRPRPGKGPIQTAIGVAVPAIEAWYLAGIDPHVSEASWMSGMESGRAPYTRNELKDRAYGTDRPSILLEKERGARWGAERSREIDKLEQLFPTGFGVMAASIRSWRRDM